MRNNFGTALAIEALTAVGSMWSEWITFVLMNNAVHFPSACLR